MTQTANRARAWRLLLAGAMLSGCTAAPAPPPTPGRVPADFALTFHVRGVDGSADPLRQTSQNIVDASRRLRAAVGPGAGPDYFPAATRVLTPAEYADLYRLAEEAGLLRTPTSRPAAASGAGVTYDVTVQADRRSYRAAGGPEAAPLRALLQRLVALRQAQPSAAEGGR